MKSAFSSFLLKRVLLVGFIATTVTSTVITALRAHETYRANQQEILKEVDGIEHVLDPELTRAIWNLDRKSTLQVLNVIFKNRHVSGIRLVNDEVDIAPLMGDSAGDTRVRTYPLSYEAANQKHDLGTLEILISRRGELGSFISQLGWTALYNLVQFSFFALLLAWIFNSQFTVPFLRIEAMTEEFTRKHVQPFLGRRQPSTTPSSTSELNRLAENIAELQMNFQALIQMRDEFLLIASHELKTPLTPLLLHLEVVDKYVKQLQTGPERQQIEERFKAILAQVTHICGLVEHLLDISSISTSRLKLTREEFDLSNFVRVIAQQFETQARSARTTITVSVEDGILGEWDRRRIQQVLGNLLANAIKYGERKPIEIEANSEPDGVVIRVKDKGIGIDEADHKRIFGRFERAASIAHFGGFGLGLYIAQEIVRAHGGSISVISRKGEGATFEVRMPLRPSAHR